MNLFDFFCMYHYYTKGNVKTDYVNINAATKRDIWQNKKFVDFFFGALDALCRIDHMVFFDKLFYICDEELSTDNNDCKVRLFRTKQCNLFKLCIENGSSMELTDLLLFYALLYYCDKNMVSDVDNLLKSYMRKVRNYFETDIQNLKTRTTVQLNLRVSEFNKYDAKIHELAMDNGSTLLASECVIDDCAISHGNTEVFKKAVDIYGCDTVVKALELFCNASQSDRVRVLIACGFKGTYLGDCIGRNRYFFGNKDKWDVLFISDKEQLSECFTIYTSMISKGKDLYTIINGALEKNCEGFIYYMLKYEEFLNANDSQHHYAIRGELDDVDWIALGSYSSNPGIAYHTDPLAASVEKELRQYGINLALYRQYSGKCPLYIVKDKINWSPLFGVISRKDGWHVIHGMEYITEEIRSEFGVQILSEQELLIPHDNKRDMIQVCVELIKKVSEIIEENQSC